MMFFSKVGSTGATGATGAAGATGATGATGAAGAAGAAGADGLQYVYRGDPTTYDFTSASFTKDSAWHTLSLAALIPANAKLVHLRLRTICTILTGDVYLRKTGVTNAYNTRKHSTQVIAVPLETNEIVDCTGQQIDYWITTTTWTELAIVVLGWFIQP